MLEIPFFTKTFAALDHSDLRELVEVKRVREHLQLDYKLRYEGGREHTIDMLADITAMANASGGYIIVGIEEDRDEDDGTPKRLVGISNGDLEANRIQSICESSIDEKISGLRVQDISIGDEKSCVVIYVPNSLRKPHMINYRKHYSFRMRNGRSNRYLDMREIRTMILSMNQYQGSLTAFLSERRNELKQTVGDKPWMLLTATPVYVDTDKIDPVGNKDLRQIMDNPPSSADSNYLGIGIPQSSQPRIYGVEARDSRYRFLRLFRNGHFEFGEDVQDEPATEKRYIHSYRAAILLIHLLDTMRAIVQIVQINEPITIGMYWCNIAGTVLASNARFVDRNTYKWVKDELLIEATVSDLADSHRIAHQLIERLYNAFGMSNCPLFDQDGQFVLRR